MRDDNGATAGLDVPIFYDPLISKLIAWAEDRPLAVARMRRALSEYVVTGIRTTLPFFAWLFRQDAFLSADFPYHYLDGVLAELATGPSSSRREQAGRDRSDGDRPLQRS